MHLRHRAQGQQTTHSSMYACMHSPAWPRRPTRRVLFAAHGVPEQSASFLAQYKKESYPAGKAATILRSEGVPQAFHRRSAAFRKRSTGVPKAFHRRSTSGRPKPPASCPDGLQRRSTGSPHRPGADHGLQIIPPATFGGFHVKKLQQLIYFCGSWSPNHKPQNIF